MMKNFLKNSLKKHFLPLLVVLSLLISFVNLFLLISLYFKSPPPVLISESLPQPPPNTKEVEKSEKLALHIERLIVLDHLFNDERNQDRELSIEELIIVESLFREEN